MKKLLIAAMLVLSLLGTACQKGGCTCPGNGQNPVCQGC